MQVINQVNKQYFQKSKVFIYPILGIKKHESISLIETYIGWNEKNIHQDDCKLICIFYLRDDIEFKTFMNKRLFSNPYFKEYFELEEKKAAFIFDLRNYKEDYKHFINGKYSMFSQKLKNMITGHQLKHSANYSYVNSFIYPDIFFGVYKDLLQVDIKLLQSVGELCDKPDLEKEILTAKIKVLELNQNKQ